MSPNVCYPCPRSIQLRLGGEFRNLETGGGTCGSPACLQTSFLPFPARFRSTPVQTRFVREGQFGPRARHTVYFVWQNMFVRVGETDFPTRRSA